ncbi:hypothetical protein [Teredinibacter waterburyi]|jgi:hypothetical protein|uniref:hypothetical protein n=1 Tax=Teredinibacter waterburyi TaxID=1500538 RepID=UPI00165F163E|nr:hypothetical protein [Teredinibacter waterburyi]
MKRYYFVSENLDELAKCEQDLFGAGFVSAQVHVLSQQDAAVEKHRLHDVSSFSKFDIFHSGLVGAATGGVLAGISLSVGWMMGAATTLDWLPFMFLAFVLFGFCTWEGGFYGIQVSNKEFNRFAELLDGGKHILMVDADKKQAEKLQHIISYYAELDEAGVGRARPAWMIATQTNLQSFVRAMP